MTPPERPLRPGIPDPLANHWDLVEQGDAARQDAKEIAARCRATVADGAALVARLRRARLTDDARWVGNPPHVSA
jgi:hypothetical protein